MAEDRHQSRERFRKDTQDHVLSVLHDDGLYRHVRFSRPGSSIYLVEVVTWPGHLAVAGDMGSFVFARTRDMFEFFGSYEYGINPDYWSEKLQAPKGSAHVREFREEEYRQVVRECLANWLDELRVDDSNPDHLTAEEKAEAQAEADDLKRAVQEQLLDPVGGLPRTRDDAIRLLEKFRHRHYSIYEPYDYDMAVYSTQFIWCLWGIVEIIERYAKSKATPVEVKT